MNFLRLNGEPPTIDAVAEEVDVDSSSWSRSNGHGEIASFGARLSQLLAQETPNELLIRLGEFKRSVEEALRRSQLVAPSVVAAERSDKLWRHTCFEMFVGTSESTAYYEFNFAPSTRWAAYRFNDYRSGMAVATEIDAPWIEVQAAPDCYTLKASVQIDRLSALSRKSVWRLGLSAVVEDKAGRMSYWALAHPPGKPDFHCRDCFAYEFSPAVSA